MLRKIFGPRRNEVTEECREARNVELIDLYCSSNIVWEIKLRSLIGLGM